MDLSSVHMPYNFLASQGILSCSFFQFRLRVAYKNTSTKYHTLSPSPYLTRYLLFHDDLKSVLSQCQLEVAWHLRDVWTDRSDTAVLPWTGCVNVNGAFVVRVTSRCKIISVQSVCKSVLQSWLSTHHNHIAITLECSDQIGVPIYLFIYIFLVGADVCPIFYTATDKRGDHRLAQACRIYTSLDAF